MSKIVRLHTIALVFWLVSLPLPPCAAERAITDGIGPLPDGLGVNIHFTDPRPGELEELAAAGFTWVRMDFAWGGIEREAGKYDFAPYDRLMRALDQHHIRAIFILDYSNRLYDQDLSPHSDDGRVAFARWAAASAMHFKGRVIVWEMYNEPNIQFWRPKPNVSDYAKLALAVGKAIREVAPDELYIGPACSTMDFKFLEECFKAGCLEYWAAVSVHPYRQKNPETVAADYARLREIIHQYAPKGKQVPIVSGEWGYSSIWKKFDEQKQAAYLPRELLTNVASGVPISIWYDWHDDSTNPTDPEAHFGTVHHEYNKGASPVYEPKPAYKAMKALTEALKGSTFSRRVDTGRDEDWVLLFAAPAGPRIAAWTTGSPHDASIPADPGKYRAVTIHLTDKPQYLLPHP